VFSFKNLVQAEKLAQDLKDLGTRGDDELRERCRNLYGTEPPSKIHRSLLIPAIAYRMQEIALGALKAFRPPPANARRQKRGEWSTIIGLSEPQS
jgi:hypothetical protein